MNKSFIILFLFCSIFSLAMAADLSNGNYWTCSAHDAENMEWVINSSYEITAIHKAFDECKKQSKIPTSCKVSEAACEEFVNGISTRPKWQCIALDQTAKEWPSNAHADRDDAAIAAKSYCQQHSSFPDTCYINLMTCKNLNSQE
ncbi:hypothetical protein Lnau_1274 [Legionella nautarum]|uniref:DUF4189 domain-containing protein n=1 Tax=Legionella nautarum TaxID=45070 RepID=A0A0W0WVF0_9GAMM|nr:hypothetical protein [Legionella nautarum]KTD36290.1 hypothetical protein Lnau_1274 [Legionella nautarum]